MRISICTVIASTGLATAAPAASLDYESLATLPVGGQIEVTTSILDDAAPLAMRLERFDVLTEDAQVIVAGHAGARFAPPPAVVLLRGQLAGQPDRRVFIGVSPFGVNGFVADADGHVERILSTGRFAAGHLAPLGAVDPALLQDGRTPGCGTTPEVRHLAPLGWPEPPSGADGPAPCRVARIAVDTDWEFTGSLFGGDPDAAMAYALTLFGALHEIYVANFNVRLHVSYLRVWEDEGDPYRVGGLNGALIEFRDLWRAEAGGIERTLAHLLSGRDLGGGIAYVGVVCSNQWGYGLSANLGGGFPYPLEDNNGGNWDLVVAAHELGHNVGTGHTHDSYDPPIDGCGNDDCSLSANGTIMSYCHICPGGLSNIALGFHPLVVDQVLGYLDDQCDLTPDEATAIDDDAVALQGTSIVIDALANDAAANCDAIVVETFDALSAQGGTVELIAAESEGELETFRYTAPADLTEADAFGYTLAGGTSATVDIEIELPRAPDAPPVTTPGATAAYYALSLPTSLPDFEAIEPYATDVVASVNYPSTGGVFATSARADQVGAVFEGYVFVDTPGIYTFYTNSDDGSRLLVGSDVVVNNDGLHSMVERSGSIALAAGGHAVRVEFFENAGGAGLIASYEGPTTAKQPIPPSAWAHAADCAADFDGTGVIDFSDLVALLSEWGPCRATCPEDLDASGTVDFSDLLLLLATWGPCPNQP